MDNFETFTLRECIRWRDCSPGQWLWIAGLGAAVGFVVYLLGAVSGGAKRSKPNA